MHRGSWLVLGALIVLGCGTRGAREREDKVVHVAEDDPKMNAAIDKARQTVDTFIQALKKPKRSQTAFSVKKAVTDGKQVEHMWLTDVRFDGTQFHGVINNDPNDVKNVKLGDKASVEKTQISDWMFVEDGKLIGGYTIRVLREGLTAKERKELDESLPFKIE
jgi:uncharacterized protein YegJ (DUF2314 family)